MLRDLILNPSSFSIDTNGINGGVIIPNSPSLNPTDVVTLVFRVWLTKGIPCNLADNSQSGVTNSYYCYVDGNGLVYWYSTIGGAPVNIIGAPAPYNPNGWNDYVFKYDGTKVEIYANRQLVARYFVTGTLGVNSQALRIGQYWTGAVAGRALFDVAKIYHSGAYTFQDHLNKCILNTDNGAIESTRVLDLNPNTGSGTTVFDRSGLGNHGAFVRGVWNAFTPREFRPAAVTRITAADRAVAAARAPVIDSADPRVIAQLNPVGWYEGDSIVGVADGGLVSSWTDLSGNGNHITAAGSLRPTFYKTTPAQLLNGKPTVFFNGTNSLKKSTGFPGQPFTVFVLARSNTEPLLQPFFDGNTGNSSVLFRLSNNIRIYAGLALGFIPHSTINPVIGNSWKILGGVFDGVRSMASLDNTEVIGNAGTTSNAGITVGALGDNSSGVNGNYAAIIVFPGNMSSDNRAIVRRYLTAKYAL